MGTGHDAGVKVQKAAVREAVLRRSAIRRQHANHRRSVALECRAEAEHVRSVARREDSGSLATARINACVKFPSEHAVNQLSAIAARSGIPHSQRVKAAMKLLDW